MQFDQIARSLAALNVEQTHLLTEQALHNGESPQHISHSLFAGLNEVAKRYAEKNHLFPDIFKASLIFNEALAKIKHQIATMETNPNVRGVIGVVYGDMQDFGKHLVLMTLEANGFDVEDLGKSVSTESFVNAAREGANYIAISIMTDNGVKEATKVVQELHDAGLRNNVKLIVGGAGVNAQQAYEIIEADGYAEDPEEVVEFLKIFYPPARP